MNVVVESCSYFVSVVVIFYIVIMFIVKYFLFDS